MWFILILVVAFFWFPIMARIKKILQHDQEDKNVSDDLKQEMKIKNEKQKEFVRHIEKLLSMKNSNMAMNCKLQNVYRGFRDQSIYRTLIAIYEDGISYEEYSLDNILNVHFSIPYDKIIDAKCDTSENLTAMRLVTLGVLAFAFKKKTYYTIITYKNDLTNTQDQLIFRVDNPNGKDEFINNLLIKRNQHLINKQEPIG